MSAHVDGILHLKLHAAADGGVWAICSGGFGRQVTGAVVAVQVQGADPDDPPQSPTIAVLSTPVGRPEGITLVGNYAYVGGISSTKIAVVDISDPARMRLVSCAAGPGVPHSCSPVVHVGGTQLVPARDRLPTGHAVVAVWGFPGGVSILDVSNPSAPVEVGRCVGPTSAMANRATILGYHVLVPLEQPVGGVAIFDVSNVSQPVRLGVTRLPSPWRNSSTYCLAVTAAAGCPPLLNVFEAKACCMHTYKINL